MARQLGDAILGLGSEAGLPPIGGVDAALLAFPAFGAGEALRLKLATGSADPVLTWAIGLDLYIPQPAGTFVSLLETGTGDGELFLRDNGDGTAGIGISGVYDGAVPFDQWNRIIATFTEEGGAIILRKFVNGALVGTQDLGATTRWAIDPAAGLSLFADDDGETASGAVASVFFTTVLPGAAEVAALVASIAAPDAAGFFPGAPSAGALEINFAGEDIAPRYGTAEVFLDGFGFRTAVAIGDSVVGFPSQVGIDAAGPEAPVLLTPGFAPGEGLAARVPLESGDLTTFTAVWDLYLDALPADFLALLQTDPLNANDGDLFIRADGGLGISGVYDGSVPVGAWTRIAVTLADQGDGTSVLSKYIDGALVGTQTVETARFTVQGNADLLLLADNDGETGPAAIAHFGLLPRALSAPEVAALGGVDTDGPFVPAVPPAGFDPEAPLQLGFDGYDAAPESGFSAAEIIDAAIIDEPPVTNPIDDLLIDQTGAGRSFVLADVFGADATGFTVTSSAGEIVAAEIVEGVLTLSPGALGHADITVTATAANGAALTDNFRAIVAGPNAYVFAIIPDTQDYTSNPAIRETFGNMTDWLLAQEQSLNIAHVIHVGDIVQFGAASQWEIAAEAMSRLDGELTYTVAVGNHDQQRPGFSSAFAFETDVDAYFTPEQVGATAAQGGGTYDGFDVGADTFANGSTYAGSIRNHYSTITTPDGTNWLILSMEFGMPDDVLRWASEVIEQHLDHRVIIDTHSWNGGDGRVTPTTEPLNTDNGGWGYGIRSNPRNVNDGEDAWRELASKYPNIAFTFNGHNFMGGAETVVSYAAGGNPVHQMFVNYQDGAWAGPAGVGSNGGNGAMRLVVIDPDNDRVTTHTKLVELDTFFDEFPDHEEVFEGVDLSGAPEQIAIAKAGATETVTGDGIAARVTLDASATIGDVTGARFEWFAADGEKLGETAGEPLVVDLRTGTNRLVLQVTDQNGNVSTDDKVVIVEAPDALLTETFDDGDLAGWTAPARAPEAFFDIGTDLGFALPSIGGAGQIPVELSFASSFRPYANQTGEVLVSFDGGATFSTLLTLDNNTVPGGESSLARANELVTLEALVPTSASLVQFAWRLSEGGNDWWWAIDSVAVSSSTTVRETILAEDFEGLTLLPFQSASEGGGDGTDWTDVAPDGWTRDNTDTPAGGPVEFQGWTFLDRNSWIATAGNQSRGTFTLGTGTVAVADGDEYDDLGNIDPDLFNAFLVTPEIDLAGYDAGSLQLAFDSSFRPYDTQTGTVEVSFDGGATFSALLTLDNTTVPGGDSSLDRANERVTLAIDAGGASSMILRWGLTDAGNDWWWAVDNIALSAERSVPTMLLAEDFDGLALQGTVDETDPGRPVWTPVPPADWDAENAAGMPQGVTEFQGWTFMERDFWIATAGNQARDTFTLASGNVAVADPDEWDDRGAPASAGTFDSRLATPLIDITALGGGQAGGGEAGVVRVPALTGEEGILVTPTGASGRIDSYSLVFDLLVPETTEAFAALFQTDLTNATDGELFLRNDGASASIGISGNYDGALAFGEWGRIALVFETDAAGQQTLSKYLDGVFLDSQVVDADVSDGSRWSFDAAEGFLLFSDNDGDTAELYANALHFTTEVLDAATIAALGGVDVDGPAAASADPAAFQLSFDGALDTLDYGSATIAAVSLGGPETSYLVKGSIFGNPNGVGEAALYQQSNGANELLLWSDGAAWADYSFDLVFEPADNDTFGAVFYYQDAGNHYRLTLDQQNDTRSLVRVAGGVETVLATETGSYRHFAMQDLRIAVLGGTITVTLDDELLFDGPVTDAAPLAGGTVGILTQSMNRVAIDNISVNPVALAARALTPEPEGRWAVDMDGDGTAAVAFTAAASLSASGIVSHEWLVGDAVVATGETAALDLAPGETTVTLRVTDAGGRVSEDRITVEVADHRAILVADDFTDGDFAGWSVVDEGTIDAPSDWQVVGGALVQASNINSTQLPTGANAYSVGGDGPFLLRDGTYALWNDPAAAGWTDYAFEATITPADDDGIGLLFRYVDAANYYKLELDSQTGIVMLTRHLEGRETILARGYGEYTPGVAQNWRIEAEGGLLTAWIDGRQVFGTEIDDRTLPAGTVGLYGWGSENLAFDNVVVTDLAFVPPPAPDLDVALIDARTGERIATLGEGGTEVLASAIVGRDLTIAAFVPGESPFAGRVESIRLDLNDGERRMVDNVEPYALFGDFLSLGVERYRGREGLLDAGPNSIALELYARNAARGELIDTITRDFTVIDDVVPVADDLRILLVDARRDEVIAELTDGAEIDRDLIDGRKVSIAVFVEDSFLFDVTESMRLTLNERVTRTENVEPYSLFGNVGGNFSGKRGVLEEGVNTLELDLFSDNHLRGDDLGSVSITFSIVDSLA